MAQKRCPMAAMGTLSIGGGGGCSGSLIMLRFHAAGIAEHVNGVSPGLRLEKRPLVTRCCPPTACKVAIQTLLTSFDYRYLILSNDICRILEVYTHIVSSWGYSQILMSHPNVLLGFSHPIMNWWTPRESPCRFLFMNGITSTEKWYRGFMRFPNLVVPPNHPSH
jgi:hypothetical protein